MRLFRFAAWVKWDVTGTAGGKPVRIRTVTRGVQSAKIAESFADYLGRKRPEKGVRR